MRKFFVKNIFFLLLVNLVVKPVWIFAIDRNVQNTVGHEAYGQYQALLSFSIIFQVLLDFGLQSYNSRTVSQSPRIMQTLFPNIVLAKALLSLFYFILIVLLGWLVGYRGYAMFLLICLSFVQILNSFLLYLRSNVAAMQQFKTDSLLSVSDRLLMIVICGFLLFFAPWEAEFKIQWFIYAQIASYLVTGIIAFFICRKMTATLRWGHFRALKMWAICKHSFPYALLIFLMAVYLRADAVIMERLLPDGKEQAGVFAAGFRLLDVANNMSGVLFAGILLPLFGRLLARREAVDPIIRVSVNLLLPFAFTAMLTAWFFGTDIMKMLYDEATAYDGQVFSILMTAFPGFCISYVYATLLTANGNLKPLIILSFSAVVINLSLNFILIPAYGALGAAVTAALTQVLLAVTNIRIAQRLIKLRPDWRWLAAYLVFFALMFSVCWILKHMPLGLWIRLMLIAGSGGSFMLLCGFVPLQKLKMLLPSNRN